MKWTTLKKFEFLVKIFVFLFKKKELDVVNAAEKLNIKYITLHRLFEKLMKEQVVTRIKRDPIIMGQPKYDYQITDRTTKSLKKIAQLMQNVFIPEIKTKTVETVIDKEQGLEKDALINEILENLNEEILFNLQNFTLSIPTNKKNESVVVNYTLKEILNAIKRELVYKLS